MFCCCFSLSKTQTLPCDPPPSLFFNHHPSLLSCCPSFPPKSHSSSSSLSSISDFWQCFLDSTQLPPEGIEPCRTVWRVSAWSHVPPFWIHWGGELFLMSRCMCLWVASAGGDFSLQIKSLDLLQLRQTLLVSDVVSCSDSSFNETRSVSFNLHKSWPQSRESHRNAS